MGEVNLASVANLDLLKLVRAEQVRRRLHDFIRITSPNLLPPPHLKPVIELWQQTAERQVFGVIELPPRHAKTTTAMHALAWHVLRSPQKTSVYATYAQTLARSKSRSIRNLALESGAELAPDMANLDEWRTTKGGGLLVTGVGGPLTGQGITGVAVVDDALKNREDANSETIRDSIWDWFRDVVWTRLEEQASVIVMATRWHESDLIGKLLSGGVDGVPFERVRLPALAEAADPLGRTEGEALWPERFDAAKLAEIKSMLGSFSFASLYQQAPTPAGGGLFKREWFKLIDPQALPTRYDDVAITVDARFGDKKDSGSFVAILVVARLGAQRYVLDNDTRRLSFVETCAAIAEMRAKWPATSRVLVEKKANGDAVVDYMKSTMTGLILLEPEGGKESRAALMQPLAEAGNIVLPRGAPWLEGLLHELCTFPAGANDDQVDAMSQAITYMQGSSDAARARMLASW